MSTSYGIDHGHDDAVLMHLLDLGLAIDRLNDTVADGLSEVAAAIRESRPEEIDL